MARPKDQAHIDRDGPGHGVGGDDRFGGAGDNQSHVWRDLEL